MYFMGLDELKNLIKRGMFNSPTKGAMDLSTVVSELVNFKKEKPEHRYKIVIGTDSERKDGGSEFVCVVAIHRIGKGGRYFWLRIYDDRNLDLRNRIYQEATVSLALAGAFLERELELHDKPATITSSISGDEIILHNELEIHVDIGQKGPTKEMIREIKGMISGSGFFVKIKPESFAASTLADKHL